MTDNRKSIPKETKDKANKDNQLKLKPLKASMMYFYM